MNPPVPNLRYERKFSAGEAALPQVLALLRQHPAAFREVFSPRNVNNIYFDSHRLRDYYDHVNGAANRLKTRVRWYGGTNGQIPEPKLERKIKRGLVSGKLVHELPPISLNGNGVRAPVEAAFGAAPIPEHLRDALRFLQPTLLNRYRRRYFLSADGRFRLTLDSDLLFGSPSSFPGGLRSTPLLVIELKFAPAHAVQAERVANAFPFRVVRCSKYVLGIERTVV